ncbi:outer membrane protein [Desulfatirhabdium butyrativorans]|uniref:outer membrane protein n=1 Tax=Desulfatirhabdium butyrativorans TaxID=340467 RepID=UPI0004019B7C|nr:outer membrane beta-barrel protein [Desulfatirhabdium butyrativorans]
MAITKTVAFLVALLVAPMLLVASADAGFFYAGTEIGYAETRFEPQYSYMDGSPNDRYVDLAYGQTGSLIFGYMRPLGAGLSMGLQGRIGLSNDEWTLYTNEPAHLTYRIPYSYAFGLRPALRISDSLSVFFDGGIGQGNIQEKKESPFASRYDINEWKLGYTAGAGIEYHLSSVWSMNFSYRYTAYDRLSYDSYMPNGSHWETVEDEPKTQVFSFGLTWYFLP